MGSVINFNRGLPSGAKPPPPDEIPKDPRYNTGKPSNIETTSKEEQFMAVTRYELDAKCQAIEAAMDARVQRMESKLDNSMGRVELIVGQIKTENSELKSEFRNAKLWAIGTAITVLFGFAGIVQLISSWQQSTIAIVASRTDATNDKIEKLSDALMDTNKKLDTIILNKNPLSGDLRLKQDQQ
jgi:hypothetical protein